MLCKKLSRPRQHFVSEIAALRFTLCSRPAGARGSMSKSFPHQRKSCMPLQRASADLNEMPTARDCQPKTHLFLLVSGLAGSPANWEVMMESLNHFADTSTVALLASGANTGAQTLHGIDACGERLADELQSYVTAHPSLQRITVLGHSMGGLIVRYLIGRLYNPATGLIAGLQPAHFFAMATPHMGCGGQGIIQVSFFRLFDYLPVLGPLIRRLVAALAPAASSLFMRRTGAHFFLHDRDNGKPPLLTGEQRLSQIQTDWSAEMMQARLSRDVEGEGQYISALGSFVTRTAYANSSGDHLINWPNASLRRVEELPSLPAGGTGVVRADPVHLAYWPHDPVRLNQEEQHRLQQPRKEGVPETDCQADDAMQTIPHDTEANAPLLSTMRKYGGTGLDSPMTLDILSRLKAVPWRRVDVSFKGYRTWSSTHNLIQVTRRKWHYKGVGVGQHLAQQFAAMEEFELCTRQPAAESLTSIPTRNGI